jgi:hypothetical protein
MHSGRTVFSQIMDFAPWYPFDRCVGRYGGDPVELLVSRPVPLYGLRSIGAAGEFARHRGVASVGPNPGLASAVGVQREPYPKAASGGGGATLRH